MNVQQLFITCALSTLAIGASAQDWPRYLGPTSDSKSTQKNLLREWPSEGPEVLWTVPVGIGYGGPVVEKGKIYLLDRDADKEEETMRCLTLDGGKELWHYTYPSPGAVQFPGSRSVPAVEGKLLFSCGHNGDFYCFDTESGKPLWNKNIWKDYGGDKLPIWAIAQCPLIYGDLVYVYSEAPGAGLLAFKKQTGEVVWQTKNLGPETYASPSIVRIDGEDHLSIVISSTNPIGHRDAPKEKGRVIGFNPKTGEELWRYDNWECHISCSPVTEAGDGKLLVVGGYERGATMIQVQRGADGKFTTKELFTTVEFGDQTKPALFLDGYFYGQYGTSGRRDGLTCMDMEGNIKWKTKRNPNFDKGSMIYADGLILATDGNKTLYLIEPSAEAFKPISKANLLEEGSSGAAEFGGRIPNGNWAPLALADGKLLIRNHSILRCVKVTK